jgi:hypothetical protein
VDLLRRQKKKNMKGGSSLRLTLAKRKKSGVRRYRLRIKKLEQWSSGVMGDGGEKN